MVRSGDSVSMTCNFDLEGKILYTVKWYLDEAEFYRFTPKREPPGLVLPVRNLKINLVVSNMNEVVLLNVTRNQSGMYKCEASEELPLLETRAQQASMMVVDVPEEDPIIVTERHRLLVGETLRATCTSGASFPLPNIAWTINEEPISSLTKHAKVRFRNITIDQESIGQSRLELKILHRFFQNNKIKLRCFVNIHPIYHASMEIEILEDEPHLASITGDASHHRHRTNGSRQITLSQYLQVSTIISVIILTTTRMR
ncbi:uncharacterized protein LOC117167676 isoform X2 [Belonocnema kinseyi]|nr:uncharacterized protein LOC117167676 isoform X2 [Belonocnema kinseyi]